MSFNPFIEKVPKVEKTFEDWKKLYAKAYNKNEVDPYTKVRIIVANGAEFESVWFSHQFHRHCENNDIRRNLALVRRSEQQQQKRIASLKPIDESLLETTIGYEQVAVDLTVNLASQEADSYVKAALDFALLEDFDHLYRYADLLEMEQGIKAERLVGGYTEIMPGRPTICEHRFPFDDVKRPTTKNGASLLTKLNINIITAAEQQTMNYYMNQGQFYTSDLGRKLFAEIAMIEEQHVTHYGSLLDVKMTWLENLVMHEYTECYLYYSLMMDETDENVKKIWEHHLLQEIAHVQLAAEMLAKYEKTDLAAIVGNGEFPKLLAFTGNSVRNREYVREILKKTISNTAFMENYTNVTKIPDNYEFYKFNNAVNKNVNNVASHNVINSYIAEFGQDYRLSDKTHPVKELRDRTTDNTDIGKNN
jgi:rubrerythrin